MEKSAVKHAGESACHAGLYNAACPAILMRESRMDGGARMEMKFPEKGFAGKVVLKDGDKDVSWLWIQDMDISFSGHAVKTGGIAGVGTENEHRGKGYSRKILTSSVALMKKHKVPLSLLYGIRHYYTRYGYAVVYPDYRAGVHVFFAKRLPQPKGYVWRKIEPDDMPAVIRLYNKTCWPRTGMRARDPGKYRFFKGSNWNAVPEPFGLFRKGKLCAYTVLDLKPDGVEVVDTASASYEDSMALVSCLAAEDQVLFVVVCTMEDSLRSNLLLDPSYAFL